MEVSSSQVGLESERVAELQAQVDVLQQKLHQLHTTDVNTLRRGYATVAQHVQALKLEAARLEELVNELEPQLYPPEYIAEELGKAAVVSGSVFVIFKVVKTITPLPAQVSSWLRSGLAAVTAIVVTWRFARSSISRFAASLLDHKRRRKAVLREMGELQQRVDILVALTSSMPQALLQQQQVRLAGQQAASSTAADAAAAAIEEAGGTQQQQQQQQRGEQFVVVDLPRVESGGFVLTSPAASSSPAPELAAAQQAAAAFAAASTAAAAAAAVTAVDSQAVAAAVQQRMVGTAAAAARSAAAAVGAAFHQQASAGSTATHRPQQQQQEQHPHVQQQQQQQQQQQEPGPSASSSTRSSFEQRQPLRSAFAVPMLPSMIMSGWGGVVMQQEQRAHLHSSPTAATAAAAGSVGPATDAAEAEAAGSAAAGRQASGDSEGQGEWVERPGCFDGQVEGPAAAAAAGGGWETAAVERVSPHSSSSDEGVLLERE